MHFLLKKSKNRNHRQEPVITKNTEYGKNTNINYMYEESLKLKNSNLMNKLNNRIN